LKLQADILSKSRECSKEQSKHCVVVGIAPGLEVWALLVCSSSLIVLERSVFQCFLIMTMSRYQLTRLSC
jgi:hypothetical protein